jgi:peptide deformylase
MKGNMIKLISGKNKKLRTPSSLVVNIKEATQTAKKMICFLNKYKNGCGLSSVQIGILKQIFIIKVKGTCKIVINPEILSRSQTTIILEEGCLSFPNKYKKIERNEIICVRYHNGLNIIEETLSGFTARVFQHEYDHLQGKICVM